MNLAQIRAFHAVAVHRGFSAAAQALGVSQPAVTQQIKAIEEALGARLFIRRASHVELTAEGQSLLPHVHRAALMLDDLGTRVADGRDLRLRHLAVGICAPYVVMPILQPFMAAYPGIKVDIRLENSKDLLDLTFEHHIDLTIATMTEPHPDFFCAPLVDQRVLVLVPPGHKWRERDSIDLEELEGETFVMREAGSMTRQLFEQALSRKGVQIATRLVLSSRETVKEAVAAGLGCGIVLDRELGDSPLQHGIPVNGTDMTAREYIVALPDLADLGVVAAFIATAQAVYGRTPAASLPG